MSEVKVNKISPRTNCGTVQLGDSGDTITIPAGATITNNGTQTGFGRTGTVDWQTSIKTADFSAVSGEGYFVNTTSGAVTVTLPASPSAGDIVSVKDYAQTFDTNNCTIGRNSQPIEGQTFDLILDTEGVAITLIYGDATKGWQAVNSNEVVNRALYVTATGGTITTCGDFKVHTFTGPGTFCVSCGGNAAGSNTVDYLVVAGGGGGGRDVFPANRQGGGGGAGGFRVSNSYSLPAPTMSPLANPTGLSVPATAYPITVGGGGAGGNDTPGPTVCGAVGSNSIFSTITSAGGGGGQGHNPNYGICVPNPHSNSQNGGSGAGSGGAWPIGTPNGVGRGNGNFPPVSPSQGNPAGTTWVGAPNYYATGGGGAGAPGGASSNPKGGDGGIGSFVSPSFAVSCAGTPGPVGSTRYFSGGGGSHSCSTGGAGGGGDSPAPNVGQAGTANTGGGAGGSRGANGGTGGSGIVIIRYKFQN